MLRIGFEAGVIDLRDLRVIGQPAGHLQRAGAVPLHPQFQGLQPAQDQHGVERRHHRAGHILHAIEPDLGNLLGGANHKTGNHIPMAAEIFGC